MDFTWATGRRKCGAAQVRIRAGSGRVTVNKRDFEAYFPTEALRGYILQPLQVTGAEGKYDIICTVKGGGDVGQAGAVRLGIARALEKYNGELRQQLKDAGHLSRDPRKKERKKPGQPGARKKFQFSKR